MATFYQTKQYFDTQNNVLAVGDYAVEGYNSATGFVKTGGTKQGIGKPYLNTPYTNVAFDSNQNPTSTTQLQDAITSIGYVAPIKVTGGLSPIVTTYMSTNKLIGRYSAGSGVMEEITLGTGLYFTGSTLNITGGGVGTQNLASVLSYGALTNEIPITSNDGLSRLELLDGTVRLSYNNFPTVLSYLEMTSAGNANLTANNTLYLNAGNQVVFQGTGYKYIGITYVSAVAGFNNNNELIPINLGTGLSYDTATDTLNCTVSGGVTSVALSMPSAFSVSGSPITTSGTFSVTGAGTTSQYIRGDGSLATFPSLTGYVPYTGATTDVDLGSFSLSANKVKVKGTGGNGYLGLRFQSASASPSANESGLFADSVGNLAWHIDGNYLSTFSTSANTADRIYTFPDRSLTIDNITTSTTTTGTGFLKGNGSVISFDNTSYQPLATNLTSLSALTYASTSFVKMTASGTFALDTASYLTSISGTPNRISVSGSTIDISATYVGQTSITTLGTIGTGTWQGTAIAVLNGGTGATTASGARTNLGLGTAAVADFTDWTDFTSTASAVGWTSATVTYCQYTKIGKVVTIRGRITGTSNSTSTSLTLPFSSANLGAAQVVMNLQFTNNGTVSTTAGAIAISDNSTSCIFYRDGSLTANGWTNSGTKTINFLTTYISA